MKVNHWRQSKPVLITFIVTLLCCGHLNVMLISSHLSEGLPNNILHVVLSLLILAKHPIFCKLDLFTLNTRGV